MTPCTARAPLALFEELDGVAAGLGVDRSTALAALLAEGLTLPADRGHPALTAPLRRAATRTIGARLPVELAAGLRARAVDLDAPLTRALLATVSDALAARGRPLALDGVNAAR